MESKTAIIIEASARAARTLSDLRCLCGLDDKVIDEALRLASNAAWAAYEAAGGVHEPPVFEPEPTEIAYRR